MQGALLESWCHGCHDDGRRKEENERRWKTKNGFDNVDKTLNWNAHPKAPDAAGKHELTIPYHIQRLETKE